MRDKIHRIIRLVRVLGTPDQEIIGPYIIDGDVIDTIEVIDDDVFCLNCWADDFEFQLYSDCLYEDQLDEIIEQLEHILLN